MGTARIIVFILTGWTTYTMSITIIQGHHARLPSLDLLSQLQQFVRSAGQTLEFLPCKGLADFVAQMRATRSRSTEFILLDPGDLAYEAKHHPEFGLHDAFDQLAAPYIEVHDESDAELDHPEGSRHTPVATVIIHSDIARSYRIGLGIALRQLSTPHAVNDA